MKNTLSNWLVIEGFDGAGKSGLAERINAELVSLKGEKNVVWTREPGGTPFSEYIRETLIFPTEKTGEGHLSNEVRLAGMFTSRFNHYQKKILPALLLGKNVVCERFDGSTFAYQAFGDKLAMNAYEALRALGQFAEHFVIYLDVNYENSQQRLGKRNKLDEIEKEKSGREKMEHARAGMLHYLKTYVPDNHIIIDTNALTPDEVWQVVLEKVLGRVLRASA